MVATLFTEKARALNLSSYIDVCTTVRTLWKTYNVHIWSEFETTLFLAHQCANICALLGKTLVRLSKIYFHSEPSLATTNLREFASTTTTPGQRLNLGNIFWKLCLLHKFAQKNIFAHCKSTVCMFSTIQRSFTGKASNQNDSSNTFSYTLCQTKPNCIDLWDLNVVGLLVLVTLHTVPPCVLLCLVHTHSQQVPVSTKELISLQYIAKLSFKCRLAE